MNFFYQPPPKAEGTANDNSLKLSNHVDIVGNTINNYLTYGQNSVFLPHWFRSIKRSWSWKKKNLTGLSRFEFCFIENILGESSSGRIIIGLEIRVDRTDAQVYCSQREDLSKGHPLSGDEWEKTGYVRNPCVCLRVCMGIHAWVDECCVTYGMGEASF